MKGEDEPSLAQRAPRSTHLEVARMAAHAQPKGTPVKAKPEAKPEPEELSKKKKEKTKSAPKKKSKGKGKVEEKPNHMRYAVEGEPHRTMPRGAIRGEKYQAGAAYDNDVQAMQRTLESEYEVSLGRVCQHYKVCLAEETQARRELGLALLLVTDVWAYSVQMVLRCGTKNAQSTAHNPSSFHGHCRWPRKHTHNQPHSGGIGRRHFHWGTDTVIYCVVNAFSTFG